MINVLRIYKQKSLDILPRMICRTETKFCKNNIKGILVAKNNVNSYKKGEHLVIINNSKNLDLKSILSALNLEQDDNIEMEVIPDYMENCFEFSSCEDFKKKTEINMKEKKKVNYLKYIYRKKWEEAKGIVSSDEIEKMCDSLNLPKNSNINKADYLEFYFYFGNSHFYEYYKDIKDPKISWKIFKSKVLPTIRYKDIKSNKKFMILGDVSKTITKTKFKEYYDR